MKPPVALLLVPLLGCAEIAALDAELTSLRAVSHDARARGALHCAPEELASAEAHLTFAAEELEQGNPARAREHVVLARANARAALRLSTHDACRTSGGARPGPVRTEHSTAPATSARRSPRPGSTKENAPI